MLPVVPLDGWHDRGATSIGPLWLPVTGHVRVRASSACCCSCWPTSCASANSRPGGSAVVLYARRRRRHMLKGPHPVALRLCVGMLVALHRLPRRPSARRSDPPSLLRLVRFVPMYLRRRARRSASSALWTERVRMSPGLTFVGVPRDDRRPGWSALDGPYTYPSAVLRGTTSRTRWSRSAWSAWSCSSFLLFRPLAARAAHTERRLERTPRRLVHTYGWDTLAYFALRGDKSFFFSSRRRGDDRLHLHRRLRARRRRPDRGAELGRRRPRRVPRDVRGAGLDARAARRPRGEHAALLRRVASRPSTWATRRSSTAAGSPSTARRRKSLRARRAPGRSARYTFQMHRASRTPRPRWSRSSTRSARGGAASAPSAASRCRSRRTSSGSGRTPSSCSASRSTSAASPGGFLRVVPAYGQSFGYTLDLMRHDPDAPNGMTEFLIASTAETRCAGAAWRGCR